jgi:hypothetical protein
MTRLQHRFDRRFAYFLALLLAFHCGVATALERAFPANSVQVRIQAVNDPYLVASGKTYHMPPGMLIYNSNNMTIVRSALPVHVFARIQLDFNGELRRIWILNRDEVNITLPPSPAPTEQLQ